MSSTSIAQLNEEIATMKLKISNFEQKCNLLVIHRVLQVCLLCLIGQVKQLIELADLYEAAE